MAENEISGVLIVNKHQGVTSHDIVNKIRRLFCTKRVGHAGTLDPMATGVLVILLGRTAKASDFVSAHAKEYRAVLRLGITTDTEDTTGNILTATDKTPGFSEVLAACNKFKGKIMQIPPMYSAIKVGGKKLYELARNGVEIERTAREIEIFSLECGTGEIPGEYILDIHCSSGTYVRTICSDIGADLGCGGAMAGLTRVKSGNFHIRDAHTIEELEAIGREDAANLLIPTDRLFTHLSSVTLPHFYENLIKNGCEIYQKKIGTAHPCGTLLRIYGEAGNFIAIAEATEFESGTALKAVKLFDLEK